MNLDITEHGTTSAVLVLNGRLNLVSSPMLREAVADVIAAGRTLVVVDLGAVSFVDSSGLGALVAGLKTARAAGGDLRMADAPEQVASVLRLTNLDRVLRVHPTVEAALDA
jgi:anti-sigma B factor antagonist